MNAYYNIYGEEFSCGGVRKLILLSKKPIDTYQQALDKFCEYITMIPKRDNIDGLTSIGIQGIMMCLLLYKVEDDANIEIATFKILPI